MYNYELQNLLLWRLMPSVATKNTCPLQIFYLYDQTSKTRVISKVSFIMQQLVVIIQVIGIKWSTFKGRYNAMKKNTKWIYELNNRIFCTDQSLAVGQII